MESNTNYENEFAQMDEEIEKIGKWFADNFPNGKRSLSVLNVQKRLNVMNAIQQITNIIISKNDSIEIKKDIDFDVLLGTDIALSFTFSNGFLDLSAVDWRKITDAVPDDTVISIVPQSNSTALEFTFKNVKKMST